MKKSIQLILTLSVFIYAVHCQQTIVDVSTEALCTQSPIQNPSGDSRWAKAGLDVYVDTFITCGDIIAFKLEWFPVGSGKWSDWFVVGINDIDTKSDGPTLKLKRFWSYFADHRHTYIICNQNVFQGCNCNSKSGSQPISTDIQPANAVPVDSTEAKLDPAYIQQINSGFGNA
jgi:hypothetical protein